MRLTMWLFKISVCFYLCSFATAQNSSNPVFDILSEFNFGNSSFIKDVMEFFQNNPAFLNFLSQLNSENSSFVRDLIETFQNNPSPLDNEIANILESLLSNNTSVDVETLIRSLFPDINALEDINVADVFMFAANAALQSNGVSENCRNDIGLIITNLLQQTNWALQMVDAMGKPESGVLEGNVKWLGNYQQCVDVRAVTDGVEHFTGKYCKVKILVINLEVGTCTSDSCSASDINGLLTTLMTVPEMLMNGTPLFQTEVSCAENTSLPTDVIVCICLLAVLLAFVIMGTLYDAVAVQMKTKKDTNNVQMMDSLSPVQTGKLSLFQPKDIDAALPNAYISGGYANMEGKKGAVYDDTKENGKEGPADSTGVVVTLPPVDSAKISMSSTAQAGTSEKILMAFSSYTNGVKILDTRQGAGTLGSINGIRFLSMAWVILGHTYYFCYGYDTNLPTHFLKSMLNWTFLAIPYASVSVDSFFALSGILVAYLTLKELKRVEGARNLNWFMFYFHRFWRLTPPYMLVLMVGTVILPYILNGPMWTEPEMPTMDTCRKTWWTNILYINNYVKTDEICMGWSWYLSNDMQFYVISPLMIIPLFYKPIIGAVSCIAFLTATTVAAGVVAYDHRYPVQSLSPFAPQPNDADYMKNVYFPSYARLGPYVVGLFTGFLLYRMKCKCRIPKVVNIACWFIAIALCCVCVYSPYTDYDSHIFTAKESAAYNALHRTGWALAVCWIVFACATGHGGWVDQLLSWKAFVPLGRLTYSAYLIHPLLMLTFYKSRNSPTYFSNYEVLYLFLGHITLSYGIGFIVSLMFESPMMGLEKVFFRRGRK